MKNNDLILEISKKTGLSEKNIWTLIKDRQASGISEDGAIKMLAIEKGVMEYPHVLPTSKKPMTGAQNTPKQVRNIGSLKEGDRAMVRAAIMQCFETKNMFFFACPVCGKSVHGDYCQNHTNETPQTAMKLSCILDDGTGNARAILFNNAAQTLMNMAAEDAKQLFDKNGFNELMKNIPMGCDFIFTGYMRMNSFFGRNELVVSSVKNVNVLDEIEIIERELGVVSDE